MTTRTFHSIFKQVEEAKTKQEKINILRSHSSPTLKTILGFTYDPYVKWLLPETDPPYTPLPKNADAEVTLQAEARRFYLFVEGLSETQKNLKQIRREALFIQILESVHPDEINVVLGMKNRKLPYRGLTRKLVAEAFPNLAKNWF
jgi:hypothetical protein